MKAAIALLTGYEVQNWVRQVVVDLNRAYGVPFHAAHNPTHVTLKQGFAFESMARLERYFGSLAASIAPFEVVLKGIYHARWGDTGFLGLDVEETGTLRALHARINRELAALFEDPSAPHDGEGYRFHLTVEMGAIEGDDPFLGYYEGMADRDVDLRFTAQYIALAYAPGEGVPGSFIIYRVLPLTGGG